MCIYVYIYTHIHAHIYKYIYNNFTRFAITGPQTTWTLYTSWQHQGAATILFQPLLIIIQTSPNK